MWEHLKDFFDSVYGWRQDYLVVYSDDIAQELSLKVAENQVKIALIFSYHLTARESCHVAAR